MLVLVHASAVKGLALLIGNSPRTGNKVKSADFPSKALRVHIVFAIHGYIYRLVSSILSQSTMNVVRRVERTRLTLINTHFSISVVDSEPAPAVFT